MQQKEEEKNVDNIWLGVKRKHEQQRNTVDDIIFACHKQEDKSLGLTESIHNVLVFSPCPLE